MNLFPEIKYSDGELHLTLDGMFSKLVIKCCPTEVTEPDKDGYMTITFKTIQPLEFEWRNKDSFYNHITNLAPFYPSKYEFSL